MQFVRRETTTTTWFRKITADIHRVTTTGACEARYLRGQKASFSRLLSSSTARRSCRMRHC